MPRVLRVGDNILCVIRPYQTDIILDSVTKVSKRAYTKAGRKFRKVYTSSLECLNDPRSFYLDGTKEFELAKQGIINTNTKLSSLSFLDQEYFWETFKSNRKDRQHILDSLLNSY